MKKFLAVALLSAMSIHADAAVISISRPVTISRPIISSRPITTPKITPAPKIAPAKPAPKPASIPDAPRQPVPVQASTTNIAVVAATTAMATTAVLNSTANASESNSQTVSVSGEDKDTRITKVSVPFLTLCTAEQFANAVEWQGACIEWSDENSLDRVRQSCALLSYQRFCEPATPEQVVGKRPVKSSYTNTFMRD